MTSTLIKKQSKKYGPKIYVEGGTTYRITATVRHDDDCGNGHNTFSITGEIDRKDRTGWRDDVSGCIHNEITKHFPELAPFIKWHLCSTDGPLHYVANTMYHADEHGPTHAWVEGVVISANGSVSAKYFEYEKIERAKEICAVNPTFTMKPDEKTAKVANLDHARSSAIWPEATIEQLRDKSALLDRLPALMKEFKAAVESLGLTF